MRKTRIIGTESFRLAALFAILFLALTAILIGAVYWIVEETQTSTLLGTIDADINTIRNGYRQKGESEAVEIVQQRLGSPDYASVDLPGGYILLQDRGKGKLAGNLSPMPPTLGLMTLPSRRRSHREHEEHAGSGTMLGRGVALSDSLFLFVGRDTAAIAATRTRILQAFAWIAGATLILATLGGIFFSLQFMRRIDAIARTCDAIVAGRFHDRIVLRGGNDELDRLAGAINSMLDRIAALLDNLRQVSSDVAHDLRTPLTHLRQRLEHAHLKSETMDDYATAVARAIGDTDELLAIFMALLRISQIEAGTRLAAFSVLSLNDVLQHVYEMYRPVAEDQHQALRLDLHDTGSIRGDAELLTQLFSNLIENALRHTPPGTSITVGLKPADGLAVATVCDDGPGIPVDERGKVFRRFYRVAGSRSTPGSGLGLALVEAIAHLHQAKIRLADNAPGLMVTVAIPMA